MQICKERQATAFDLVRGVNGAMQGRKMLGAQFSMATEWGKVKNVGIRRRNRVGNESDASRLIALGCSGWL